MKKWLLLLLLIPTISFAQLIPSEPTIPQQIARYAADANLPVDLAVSIGYCESRFDPHAHSKTNDVGPMQINIKTWLKKSQYLGYNIFDTLDNIRFGIYLIETQGAMRPYRASAGCWLPLIGDV